jgi:hypothetical protein
MKTIRVKETMEGLYLKADDVEQLIASYLKCYPNRPLRVLWDVIRTARREYVNGEQNV